MDRSLSHRKSGRGGFLWGSPTGSSTSLGSAVSELRSAAKHIGRAADAEAAAGEHVLK